MENVTPPTAGIEKAPFDVGTHPVINSRGIEPVYANNAAVFLIQHDIRITFSELLLDGPADDPRVELRANVALSPTMAKALSRALSQTIEQYEKTNGEIKWPQPQQKIG